MEIECIKRQEERRNGETQFRCINPEANEYKSLVVLQQCAGCPVRKFRPPQDCKEAAQPKVTLPILTTEHEGYPACPYRYKGADSLYCSITNLPVDKDICGRCDAEVRERTAGTLDKITNYFGALRRWVALGRPTRTPEEIEHLFNTHCKGCDRYDPVKHACKNCGCSVSVVSDPLDNKLAMGSEHCPLGRF